MVTCKASRTFSESIELACNFLVDDIRKKIDNSLLTEVIYLDLSKAFDTVIHRYLLSKLISYGIGENEITWFENYLFNQKQLVFYEDHLLKPLPVFTGVPKEQFLVQHCFYSIWATLITIYFILVLSSMLTIQ